MHIAENIVPERVCGGVWVSRGSVGVACCVPWGLGLGLGRALILLKDTETAARSHTSPAYVHRIAEAL